MQNYEVHITVNLKAGQEDKFIEDCAQLDLKPLLIETDNEGQLDRQVMTSSSYIGTDYQKTLDNVVGGLRFLGHEIVREKVEIRPGRTKHEDHIYYESHLRIKIGVHRNIEGVRDQIRQLCRAHGFHMSKNLFKKDKYFVYQMITIRDGHISHSNFGQKVRDMLYHLYNLRLIVDKIEIEECVFDTNVSVDNKWLAKNLVKSID